MKCIVQRVTQAAVTVDDQIVGQIGPGLVALVAVVRDDQPGDASWMAEKLAGLRVFRAGDGKHFDRDVRQIDGGILMVSNFTVAAETRKGRRPSFDPAAEPDMARQLFDQLAQAARALGVNVATGQFAADMRVTLTNDGPATFIVDSRASLRNE